MKLFIYCAGGFGRELLEVATSANAISKRWDEIGFIDDVKPPLGCRTICGAGVRTFEEFCASSDREASEIVIGHGEPGARKLLLAKIEGNGLRLGFLADPTAIISRHATIGAGVVIAPFCSISPDATLGRNVAVNTKSIVGHDIRVGDNTVISSMVNIGGATVVGNGCYIGMGAMIKDCLKIGNDVIIGMGSVVYQDIPDGMIAMGNPARPVRRNEDGKIFRK